MSITSTGPVSYTHLGRVARSIQTHYLNIINFFERRATNAAAESFNAKLKAFRAQFLSLIHICTEYCGLGIAQQRLCRIGSIQVLVTQGTP